MMAEGELPAIKPAQKKDHKVITGGGCPLDSVCCIAGAADPSTSGKRGGCNLTGVRPKAADAVISDSAACALVKDVGGSRVGADGACSGAVRGALDDEVVSLPQLVSDVTSLRRDIDDIKRCLEVRMGESLLGSPASFM